MISWRLVAAWLAAVVLATVLTWQIVGLADSQVGETPVAVAPSLSSTSSFSATTSEGGSAPSPSSSSPTTTAPGSTGATNPPVTGGTTATTSPTASTSEGALEWEVRTVSSIGGVVVVRYRPGEVEYQAATPAPGYSLEVEDKGPERVRVDFEGFESDVRVEIRWENGQLVVEKDEDD